MKSISLSLVSGFFAASASLCGKFSMAAEQTLHMCESIFHSFTDVPISKYANSFTPFCENFLAMVRIGFFFLMILCNALMWTIFTKALRMCSTTLEATVTNTAANFFFTAVFGQVFFGESLTLIWWLGTALIITGLLLMQKSEQVPVNEVRIRRRRK